MEKISKFFNKDSSQEIHTRGLLETATQLLQSGITLDEYQMMVSIGKNQCPDPAIQKKLLLYITESGGKYQITPISVVQNLLYHEKKQEIFVDGKQVSTHIYVSSKKGVHLPSFILGEKLVISSSRGFYERITEDDWANLPYLFPEESHSKK